MHPYIVNQTTKLYADEMNRKAEIHRLVAEARRDRQLSSRSSHRRPGTVLQRLLPAALTGFTSEKC